MGFTCFACHHKPSEDSASLHLGSGVEPMQIPASFVSANTRYALKVNQVTETRGPAKEKCLNGSNKRLVRVNPLSTLNSRQRRRHWFGRAEPAWIGVMTRSPAARSHGGKAIHVRRGAAFGMKCRCRRIRSSNSERSLLHITNRFPQTGASIRLGFYSG
jgi:hypothetical protein